MEKIFWIYLAILAVGVVIGMIKAIKKEIALRKEQKTAAEREAIEDEKTE